MGYFSWIAQDSNDSIIIFGFGNKQNPSKTCYLWDNNGRRWREDRYQGDGIFGGKDYFVLLAEMNKEFDINISEDDRRNYGLEIDGQKDIIYPNITHCSIWLYITEGPKNCPYQGFSNGRGGIDGLISSYKHHIIIPHDDWEDGEQSPRHISKW